MGLTANDDITSTSDSTRSYCSFTIHLGWMLPGAGGAEDDNMTPCLSPQWKFMVTGVAAEEHNNKLQMGNLRWFKGPAFAEPCPLGSSVWKNGLNDQSLTNATNDVQGANSCRSACTTKRIFAFAAVGIDLSTLMR
mgnify:CR=1 FL=1